MQLASHHRFALAAALGLSFIAVFDAITHGVTGNYSAFSDDGNTPWIISAGGVVHGLAYAGGLWVLHAERARLHVNKPATVFSWLLFASFVPLALGFLTVMAVRPFGMLESLDGPLGAVVGIPFGLQFVAGLGLGLSLLKRPDTGPGSRILVGILGAIALTALLAFTAEGFAHPAYLEVCTIVGVALLGAAAPSRQPTAARHQVEAA